MHTFDMLIVVCLVWIFSLQVVFAGYEKITPDGEKPKVKMTEEMYCILFIV